MHNRATYLSTGLQLGKVEGLTGRDLDVVQHNGGAGSLASLGRFSGGEGAARAALNEISNRSSWGSGHGGGAEGQHGNERCAHFEVDVRSTDT